MTRLLPLIGLFVGCDRVFGPVDDGVTVSIERPASADPAPAEPPPPDAREVAERVWALLQIGHTADAEAQCSQAEAHAPEGSEWRRALLHYRCGRVAEARGDATARSRRFRAAQRLYPGARLARVLAPAPRHAGLTEPALAAVHRKLAEQGARDAASFVPVDGPLVVGAYRAATFEACAHPSEVCQGALVTLSAEWHPVDTLVYPYGAEPGSLHALSIPGANALVVSLRGDLPAQLRVGLYAAVRVDAGRITPVAMVHADEDRPERAAKVHLEGDALVIDERPAPWDARLRLFRGAPVAAASP